jgi:hypothetical protein
MPEEETSSLVKPASRVKQCAGLGEVCYEAKDARLASSSSPEESTILQGYIRPRIFISPSVTVETPITNIMAR